MQGWGTFVHGDAFILDQLTLSPTAICMYSPKPEVSLVVLKPQFGPIQGLLVYFRVQVQFLCYLCCVDAYYPA